jgi:hypothetical protein
MIWIDVRRDSYRPLRGLDPFLFFDPGAYAPGFMLTSASRTKPMNAASRIATEKVGPNRLMHAIELFHHVSFSHGM